MEKGLEICIWIIVLVLSCVVSFKIAKHDKGGK